MGNNDCCPFILRFSKSMIRPNPKTAVWGKIRTNPTGRPDISIINDRISSGLRYYQKYQYNTNLPLFSRLSLKSGSESKSLRFHFLKHTGVKLISSLSLNDFIFALNSEQDTELFLSKISNTKNSAFVASFSHISDINTFLPEEKASISYDFLNKLSDMRSDNTFLISAFKGDMKRLVSFLKNEMGACKAEIINIAGTNAVRASILDIKLKADELFTHSLVRSLSPDTVLTLAPHYIRHEELSLDCIEPRQNGKKYPKAAVADSGLSDNSYLKEWEIDSVILTDDLEKNHRHGTFVSGRLLMDGEKFGGILFLNIEILPSGGSISLDDFYKKMRQVLMKYHTGIKIYNISMGSSQTADLSEFSDAAHILDRLQHEFDVLFIISAGNYEPLRLNSENLFNEDRITCPAESINSLTVGSAAQTDTNLQIKNSPSLFTRKGPGTGYAVKPEVCAYGGAHEIKMGKVRPVGVYSIGIRNELAEDTGTSHAVPRVTALAAKIYDRYSHAFESPDMTRAMIIHNTHLKSKTSPHPFTGYGIIDDNMDNFEMEENCAVYLHSGKLSHGSITEVPDIPIPSALYDDSRLSGTLCVTLVYKPDTDINFPHFYTCSNIDLSIGYYSDGIWKSVLTAKDLLTYPQDGIPDRGMRENMKWHPVKMYEKVLNSRNIPTFLVMRLTPSKRDFCTKKTQLNYSIVISFSHESRNLFKSVWDECLGQSGMLEPASSLWKSC